MSRQPGTLFERTQGPNPVEIGELVARGERAVDAIKQDYLPFLRARLPTLDALSLHAIGSDQPERWRELWAAALDLRSSSATAGFEQLSAVGASLEWLLSEASPDHAKLGDVVRLHIDALQLLLAKDPPDIHSPMVQELLAQLAKATDHVTRG